MKRILSVAICVLICVLMTVSVFAPLSAHAEKTEPKVVRVGWYESTYSYVDQFGRRCGMVYEYQQKIAAQTGWTYEYVEDSWPNLLEMLKEGEIDLLSDVSYTPERAEKILYSSSEMGSEQYYIYIDTDNTSISMNDLTTFNGKKIGVNKDSIQAELLSDWIQENDITPEIVEMVGEESDSMAKVSSGEIDAFVSMDSMGSDKRMTPVCKVGSSDYFFAVCKDRPDLLSELNAALYSIQYEDPYYNQRLMDEWIHLTRTSAYLTPELESWLSGHETIKVGYLDDYLPFCATDKNSDDLTGALKEFLAHASICLKNASLSFETVSFSSLKEALDALKNGEVDCVFPVNLSSYDCENEGLLTSNSIMQTEMSLMTRSNDPPKDIRSEGLTVAVEEGNANFETFIKDMLPNWTVKHYPDMEACYQAVADKTVDSALVCNYRTDTWGSLENRYKLAPLTTGETMDLSFAVNRDSYELYAILNKVSDLTSKEDMDSAIVSYLFFRKEGFSDPVFEGQLDRRHYFYHRCIRPAAFPAGPEIEG